MSFIGRYTNHNTTIAKPSSSSILKLRERLNGLVSGAAQRTLRSLQNLYFHLGHKRTIKQALSVPYNLSNVAILSPTIAIGRQFIVVIAPTGADKVGSLGKSFYDSCSLRTIKISTYYWSVCINWPLKGEWTAYIWTDWSYNYQGYLLNKNSQDDLH